MRHLALVAGLLLLPGAVHAHGTSKSFSDWSFQDGQLQGRIAFGAHDLTAAYKGLDANDDGALSAQELVIQAADVAIYIAEQVEVHGGVQAADSPCRSVGAALQGLSDPVEEIQVTLKFACVGRVGAVRVRARLLPELEPPHTSVATFVGPGLDATHVFTATDPQVDLRMELPTLAEALAVGAEQTLRAGIGLRALLLLLILAWLGTGRMGWAFGAVFSVAAVTAAGLSVSTLTPWLGLLAAAWGAFEVWAPHKRPVTKGLWAVLAGAAGGWGLAAATATAELPVQVFSRGVIVVVVMLGVALGQLLPAAVRERGGRAMAVALAAGAVVLVGLTLS